MVFGIVAAVSFRPASTAKGVIGMSHFTLSRGLGADILKDPNDHAM